MYVCIVNQTTPSGQVKVKQFRDAVDEATALADFLAQPPTKNPADWLAYDTTWSGPVEPTAGKHWAYDFDLVSPPPGDRMVEVDNTGLVVCHIISLSKDDIAITSDGSWEVLGRFVLAPDELCPPNQTDRFVLRPRFAYRSTGGTPQLRIMENAAQYGNVAQFTDETGWKRDKFRAAGNPANGMNTYTLEGDRNGATLFELRGVTVEIALRED